MTFQNSSNKPCFGGVCWDYNLGALDCLQIGKLNHIAIYFITLRWQYIMCCIYQYYFFSSWIPLVALDSSTMAAKIVVGSVGHRG